MKHDLLQSGLHDMLKEKTSVEDLPGVLQVHP